VPEDALEHPDGDTCWGVPAMLFQAKRAFEGVVD